MFQRNGVNAPLDLIIALAGVGKTTFFRHFPDRQSLLATLLCRSMDELEEEADRVTGQPDGLFRLIALVADRIGLRTAFVEYWTAADPRHPAVREAFARTNTIFCDAIAAARLGGLCRADLTVNDIGTIGRMLAAVVQGAPVERRIAMAGQVRSRALRHIAMWFDCIIIILALAGAVMIVWQNRRPLVRNSYYVALGSSYAAGLGLGNRAPGSPYFSMRSVNGYPQQLARLLNVPSFTDMTSSGSTVVHVLQGGQMMLGPQVDALGPNTQLVTLTAGGNDIGYVGDLAAMAYHNSGGVIGAMVGLITDIQTGAWP